MGAGQQGSAGCFPTCALLGAILGHVDDVAERAHQSMVDRNWPALIPLLHPYLHWSGPDNVTIRGRKRVLAMLTERSDPPESPTSVELRDNQIYRWRE
jgi:hypothetical protein